MRRPILVVITTKAFSSLYNGWIVNICQWYKNKNKNRRGAPFLLWSLQKLSVAYIIAWQFKSINDKKKIKIKKNRRGAPFRRALDSGIQRLIQHGVIDHWMQEILRNIISEKREAMFRESPEEAEETQVGIIWKCICRGKCICHYFRMKDTIFNYVVLRSWISIW